MIILFSILFLIMLVYLGIIQKEGMTNSDASNLIKQLGIYYDVSKTNIKENRDNTKNENIAYPLIKQYTVSGGEAYEKIINNKDINYASQINMINTLFKNSITDNGKYTLTANQLQEILQTFTSGLKPNAQVVQITKIITDSKDGRFPDLNNYITDSDKLDYIQKQITDTILNNPSVS